MPSLNQAAEALAHLISGYRQGEIQAIDRDHVLRWAQQFDAAVRYDVVDEMRHVLEATYVSNGRLEEFVDKMIVDSGITGNDPDLFWRKASILDIQEKGQSQRKMLRLLDARLKHKFGFGVADCDGSSKAHVYLDDATFSGGRLKDDIFPWYKEFAPPSADLIIVVFASHRQGKFILGEEFNKVIEEVGKPLGWRIRDEIVFEDRKRYIYSSDVLRPVSLPDSVETRSYAGGLGKDINFRTAGSTGKLGLFSSDARRTLLEHELLKAGVRARALCPRLPDHMRPLGCTVFRTLGFGSLLIFQRNIANNTPVALWAGHPWYPLCPRKTN